MIQTPFHASCPAPKTIGLPITTSGISAKFFRSSQNFDGGYATFIIGEFPIDGVEQHLRANY